MCHHSISQIPSQSGVYAIVLDNGIYVGESVNIKKRLMQHVSRLKSRTHKNEKLINAFHSSKFVQFNVLELCKTELLLSRESYWISELQPDLNILTQEWDHRKRNEWYFRTKTHLQAV